MFVSPKASLFITENRPEVNKCRWLAAPESMKQLASTLQRAGGDALHEVLLQQQGHEQDRQRNHNDTGKKHAVVGVILRGDREVAQAERQRAHVFAERT